MAATDGRDYGVEIAATEGRNHGVEMETTDGRCGDGSHSRPRRR
jgi:hypothetical protein